MSTYTPRDDLLDSYRAARIADEAHEEERTLGYATEKAMQKAAGVRQPISLRAFLRDGQQLNPSPEERDRVTGDYLAVMQSDMARAGLAYETATRALDIACQDAARSGWTLVRIADVLGCTRQAVSVRIARAEAAHRARPGRRTG